MTSYQVVLIKLGKMFSWCHERGDFRDFLQETIGIPISVPDEDIDRHDPKFVQLVLSGVSEVDHLKVVTISFPEYCILYDEDGNETVVSKHKLNLKDARVRTRFVPIVQEVRVPMDSSFPPLPAASTVPHIPSPPKGPFYGSVDSYVRRHMEQVRKDAKRLEETNLPEITKEHIRTQIKELEKLSQRLSVLTEKQRKSTGRSSTTEPSDEPVSFESPSSLSSIHEELIEAISENNTDKLPEVIDLNAYRNW